MCVYVHVCEYLFTCTYINVRRVCLCVYRFVLFTCNIHWPMMYMCVCALYEYLSTCVYFDVWRMNLCICMFALFIYVYIRWHIMYVRACACVWIFVYVYICWRTTCVFMSYMFVLFVHMHICWNMTHVLCAHVCEYLFTCKDRRKFICMYLHENMCKMFICAFISVYVCGRVCV